MKLYIKRIGIRSSIVFGISLAFLIGISQVSIGLLNAYSLFGASFVHSIFQLWKSMIASLTLDTIFSFCFNIIMTGGILGLIVSLIYNVCGTIGIGVSIDVQRIEEE